MTSREQDGPIHHPSTAELWTIFGMGLVTMVLVILRVAL